MAPILDPRERMIVAAFGTDSAENRTPQAPIIGSVAPPTAEPTMHKRIDTTAENLALALGTLGAIIVAAARWLA